MTGKARPTDTAPAKATTQATTEATSKPATSDKTAGDAGDPYAGTDPGKQPASNTE
jgi:hypothetical protein